MKKKRNNTAAYHNRALRAGALFRYVDFAADRLFLFAVLAAILVFILWPVSRIAYKSIAGENGLSFSMYATVLKSYGTSLRHSVFVGVCTSLLTTVFSVAAAFCISTQKGAKRVILMGILLITMVSPPFVSSLAYIQLYGRRGFITHDLLGLSVSPYNQWGIILMQSLGFTPLNALYLNGLVSRIDKNSLRAARDLGAGDKAVLRDIVLPLLRPGIAVSLLLSFVRSLADFGTPVVIGGRYNTLASDIYLQIIGYADLQKASTMNMLLLIPSLLFFLLYRHLMNKTDRILRADGSSGPLPLRLHRCGAVGFVSMLLGGLFNVMMVLQYGCIFIAGFLGSIKGVKYFTLTHWQKFLTYETASLARSVRYALLVAVVGSLFAIVLTYYTERRRVRGHTAFDFIATLPYMLPGTCFGLGYLLAFATPPLKLTGTAAIVVLNMLFKQLPTSSKICTASLLQIPTPMDNAARDLGAGNLHVFFDVVLPNMGEAFYNCFVYNFTAAMTTAGAILFLIRPAQKVAVFRLFDAATTGDYAIASLIATAIIVVCVAVCAAVRVLFILLKRRRGYVPNTGRPE